MTARAAAAQAACDRLAEKLNAGDWHGWRADLDLIGEARHMTAEDVIADLKQAAGLIEVPGPRTATEIEAVS